MKKYALSDVDVKAISIVKEGANGQRIFLFKTGDDEPEIELHSFSRIVKAKDWSAFYCVVAEPGAVEKPGMYGERDSVDVWADPDEIRKAAHKFMANGALINKLHQDMEPYGQLVENAVAPQDLKITGPDGKKRTIKKDSWYVAIEPTPEGKAALEAGQFGGISIQGAGNRTLVKGIQHTERGDRDYPTATPRGVTVNLSEPAWGTEAKANMAFMEGRDWIGTESHDPEEIVGPNPLAKDAFLVPDKPGANNWIDRTGTGDLPKFMADIAGDLITERGKSVGNAIQLAIGICRNWCHGSGNVTAKTRAKACTAVAEFNAKLAEAHAKSLAKGDESGEIVLLLLDQDEPEDGSDGRVMRTLRKLAKAVGVNLDNDCDCGGDCEDCRELAKDGGTFGDVDADQKLDKVIELLEPVAKALNPEADADSDLLDRIGEQDPELLEVIEKRVPGLAVGGTRGRYGRQRIAPAGGGSPSRPARSRGGDSDHGRPRAVTVRSRKGSDRLRVKLSKSIHSAVLAKEEELAASGELAKLSDEDLQDKLAPVIAKAMEDFDYEAEGDDDEGLDLVEREQAEDGEGESAIAKALDGLVKNQEKLGESVLALAEGSSSQKDRLGKSEGSWESELLS